MLERVLISIQPAVPQRSALRPPPSALILFLLVGCQKPLAPPRVWVDVARLAPAVAPVRSVPPAPKPPAGVPAKTASLPARGAARLVAEAGIDGADLAREVERAQEASLARLRRKLSEVYRREGDRFERAQIRAMGDPYRKAARDLYPDYRAKFEAYAAQRLHPAAELAFAIGTADPRKDPNPKNQTVDTSKLDAYGKLLVRRAAEARRKLIALDEAFRAVDQEWVASIQSQGDAERAETYARIEANRDALNRQALQEATLDLGPRAARAIELRLAKRGVAQAPAVPARSVALAAVPAPPPAPQVDSPLALADARARLLGEARIWAAGSGFVLDPKGRDATAEFETWKRRRAGA